MIMVVAMMLLLPVLVIPYGIAIKLLEIVETRNTSTCFLFLPLGIFNEPNSYGGKIIGLATEYLTMEQFCDVFSKALAPRVFKVFIN
jgi:hypothetical protein